MRGLLAAQIRPFVALLIQSSDLQAAGIASAYGSRAGAVGPQCLKLRLHWLPILSDQDQYGFFTT